MLLPSAAVYTPNAAFGSDDGGGFSLVDGRQTCGLTADDHTADAEIQRYILAGRARVSEVLGSLWPASTSAEYAFAPAAYSTLRMPHALVGMKPATTPSVIVRYAAKNGATKTIDSTRWQTARLGDAFTIWPSDSGAAWPVDDFLIGHEAPLTATLTPLPNSYISGYGTGSVATALGIYVAALFQGIGPKDFMGLFREALSPLKMRFAV